MIGTNLEEAARCLEQGELIGLPTETVYGLAANALREEAIVKIFKTKNRPFFDPLICHFAKVSDILPYVLEFPAKAQLLADSFMPGPLTLILKKSNLIPDLITNASDYVAVRVPAHPVAQALLARLKFPLAAPSANPFGYISPTTAAHVEQQLGDKIPYILDGGACTFGIESTIVMFEEQEPKVLRLGSLKLEDLEKCIGPVEVNLHSSSNPQAPGQLDKHYSPHTKFVLTSNLDETLKTLPDKEKVGCLVFKAKSNLVQRTQQLVLSAEGNLDEAAKNLFAYMRLLDQMQLSIIVAETMEEKGLGRAINDRLRRAAAK